ncbi:hypothetical protein JCM8202v2_003590 [Rhodotorula sphaerocarpa]
MAIKRFGFHLLPREIVEHVVRLALDGRFLYRDIVLDDPRTALRLLATLRVSPRLAACVRALVVGVAAPEEEDDPDADSVEPMHHEALVRLCPNLEHLDSPELTSAVYHHLWPASLSTYRFLSPDPVSPMPTGIPRTIVDLQALPRTLTRLRISSISGDAFRFITPAAETFPLPQLEALFLDGSFISAPAFRWLVTGSLALRVLYLWLVSGLTDESLESSVSFHNHRLRKFVFKPTRHGNLRKNIAHDLVSGMAGLEKLTLGSGASDHRIYPNLPAFLKQLCIRLPAEHQNARLVTLADELTRRLTRIQRLELCAHPLPQPPVEIEHDTMSMSSGIAPQQTQLRILRLSYIFAAPGEILQFLFRVGGNLSSLALRHVSNPHQYLLPLCPCLQRLDLGKYSLTDTAASILPGLTLAAVSNMRIDVSMADADLTLISNRLPCLPRLSTLDLTAPGPHDQ